jgi:hypothetical protein
MASSERVSTAVRTGALVALMAVTAGLLAGQDDPARGWLVGGLVLALAPLLVALTLRRGPHAAWPDAEAALADGRAVVLWKPGCMFCERLLAALRRDPRIVWVNVWADEEANRVVRSHNDGNELTPTALVGDRVLVNPSVADLLAALGGPTS